MPCSVSQASVPVGIAQLILNRLLSSEDQETLLNLLFPIAKIQFREMIMDGERLCSALSPLSFKENKYKQRSTGGGDSLDYSN